AALDVRANESIPNPRARECLGGYGQQQAAVVLVAEPFFHRVIMLPSSRDVPEPETIHFLRVASVNDPDHQLVGPGSEGLSGIEGERQQSTLVAAPILVVQPGFGVVVGALEMDPHVVELCQFAAIKGSPVPDHAIVAREGELKRVGNIGGHGPLDGTLAEPARSLTNIVGVSRDS